MTGENAMDYLFTLPLRLDTRALPTFTRDEVLAAVRRAVLNRQAFKAAAAAIPRAGYNGDLIPSILDVVCDELRKS